MRYWNHIETRDLTIVEQEDGNRNNFEATCQISAVGSSRASMAGISI